MTRYDINKSKLGVVDPDDVMMENLNGDWIMYEDYDALLERACKMRDALDNIAIGIVPPEQRGKANGDYAKAILDENKLA